MSSVPVSLGLSGALQMCFGHSRAPNKICEAGCTTDLFPSSKCRHGNKQEKGKRGREGEKENKQTMKTLICCSVISGEMDEVILKLMTASCLP